MTETCDDCGGPNPVWFAPNDLWNQVVGSSAGVLCPICFIIRAESSGPLPTAWRLATEDLDIVDQLRQEITSLGVQLELCQGGSDTAQLNYLSAFDQIGHYRIRAERAEAQYDEFVRQSRLSDRKCYWCGDVTSGFYHFDCAQVLVSGNVKSYRDALIDTQRILDETRQRVSELEIALKHYADEATWGASDYDSIKLPDDDRVHDVYQSKKNELHGWAVAQAALEIIDAPQSQ